MVGFSYDSVYIYTVPSFERIFADSIGNTMFPVLYEKDTLIYAIYLWGTDRTDSVDLITYNYLRREIVRIWAIRTDAGLRSWPRFLDVHPDGKRLYFLGGDPNTIFSMFGCYDLETESILFTFPMYGTNGAVAVRPDGKEVYVTDPGGIFQDWPTPGTIFIFDADNGQYIDGISLFGYGTVPGIPAPGDEVVFTPTGERAFVGVGREDKTLGSILTVDTKERRVIHVAWSDLGHTPTELAIGPKL
jgi:DNA-binding beta-propeller fold protein YncE